uniref:Uncharacterized protein n=1 Tax=Cryptococcus bacillisporus CA1280 TaxID=1296109 RepID=A0A0D0ULQ6_CRYGA|nr:hypothetical protein I312_01242 [Cryptococcus bacillisporus CA1280]
MCAYGIGSQVQVLDCIPDAHFWMSFLVLHHPGNGYQYPRSAIFLFRPKWYIVIFVTCDFISLVLQAIGGGWAASVDPPTPKTPTNIMVGGIVFQLVSMIVFVGLAVDFMQRAMRRRAYKGREGEEVEMLPSTPELEMGMGKEEMYGAYAVARVTRAKEVCEVGLYLYMRLELMGFLEKASTDL